MDSKPRQFSDDAVHAPGYPESEPPTALSSAFPEKIALVPTQRWTTRPNKPRLLGLLPTALVIIVTLGFVAVILGLLLGYQCIETQGGRGIWPALKDGVFYTVEHHHQPPGAKNRLLILTITGVAVSQENTARLLLY